MDELDRKLLSEIEKGIPLTAEPFKVIAAKLKITPDEVIARITGLQAQGIIRRFGASIKPNNLGLSANALIAWNVPDSRIQEVGAYLAGFKEVTHCYQRKTIPGKWDYNLYIVMHAQERQILEQQVSTFSKATNVSDYLILYSIRDLKKANAPITTNEHSTGASAKLFKEFSEEKKND